jgi:hypothetical protein
MCNENIIAQEVAQGTISKVVDAKFTPLSHALILIGPHLKPR